MIESMLKKYVKQGLKSGEYDLPGSTFHNCPYGYLVSIDTFNDSGGSIDVYFTYQDVNKKELKGHVTITALELTAFIFNMIEGLATSSEDQVFTGG